MSDLEDRLKSWFGGEVSRAERDLATSTIRTARVRHRRPLPGLALAGLLIAVAIVALAVRPPVAPNPGLGPDGSPRSTSAVVANIVVGSDGMPTLIDGEPVLRVPDASARLNAGPPARLLVAGWYSLVVMRCPAFIDRPYTPLLPWCNPARLSAAPEQVGSGLSIAPDDQPIPAGKVVLRVHTGDPRASNCAAELRERCEKAIVVEAVVWSDPLPADPMVGRYLDGIPGDIDGERVARPSDLLPGELLGDGTILLGGWHHGERWFGCGRFGETHPLLDDCSPERISDTPSGSGPILVQARDIPDGPVVIRVHSNDPRSETCPALERILCSERLVVDELIWAGDDVTSTRPLSIDEVVGQLSQNVAGLEVEAVAMDRACARPMPPVIWRATGTGRIGLILIYPTVAARENAERHPPFMSGCNGADALILVAPSAVVENVIVYTQFDKSTTDAERRVLADAIAGWLKEIPH